MIIFKPIVLYIRINLIQFNNLETLHSNFDLSQFAKNIEINTKELLQVSTLQHEAKPIYAKSLT